MKKYYADYAKMKYNNEKNVVKKEVKIRGINTVEMPMWMINNYIKSTCDNYAKIIYILKIIEIYSSDDSNIIDIGISTSSVPVAEDGKAFESNLISYINGTKRSKKDKGYCLMSHTCENNKNNFWHYFNTCERPICFAITRENEVVFLYNPRGDEGVKVTDISYHSPIDITLNGIGECIEHLVNARNQVRNDRRLQEEHEARMVTQAMHTIYESINVQNRLQNVNLPGSQKAYLQCMYDALMEKQKKLNEQIGICQPGIDTRI